MTYLSNRRGVSLIVCINGVLSSIKPIKYYYIQLSNINLLLDSLFQTSLLNFRFVIRLNQHKSTLANCLINASSLSSRPSFLPRANVKYDFHRTMSSISNGKRFIWKDHSGIAYKENTDILQYNKNVLAIFMGDKNKYTSRYHAMFEFLKGGI